MNSHKSRIFGIFTGEQIGEAVGDNVLWDRLAKARYAADMMIRFDLRADQVDTFRIQQDRMPSDLGQKIHIIDNTAS